MQADGRSVGSPTESLSVGVFFCQALRHKRLSIKDLRARARRKVTTHSFSMTYKRVKHKNK